jgi:hypothetical protein
MPHSLGQTVMLQFLLRLDLLKTKSDWNESEIGRFAA